MPSRASHTRDGGSSFKLFDYKMAMRPGWSQKAAVHSKELMDDTPALEQPIMPGPAADPEEYRRVAPMWHTVSLLLVLLLMSYAGAKSSHPVATNQGRIPQYLLQMAWEWIAFGYALWGFKLSGVKLRDIVGERWKTVEDALLDVALAFGFWVVALLTLSATGYALGLAGQTHDVAKKLDDVRKQIGFLAPQTNREMYVFFLVSATAGFVEEILFRGYFQRQFASLTKSVWIGAAGASLVFGLAHGYEGLQRMFLIALFGMMFSALVIFKKNLRTAMMAHAMHDAFTGVLMRVLMK